MSTALIVLGCAVAVLAIAAIVGETRTAASVGRRLRGASVVTAVLGGLFGLGAVAAGVLSIR